jgi:hypothetical protein
MTFVRVSSVLVRNGLPSPTTTLVLQCVIDSERRIVDGDWFGWHKSKYFNAGYAFKYRDGVVYYDSSEPTSNINTNLGQRVIKVGELFSWKSVGGAEDTFDDTFRIEHVHVIL